MSARRRSGHAGAAWRLPKSAAHILDEVGLDLVLLCLYAEDLRSVLGVGRAWAGAALAHRARRVWTAVRASWRPFGFLFRPGATQDEVTAAEARLGRLPLGIRAVMQECQGADVPALQQPFGDVVMDLLPLSDWRLLPPELQELARPAFEEGSGGVRRIVVTADDSEGSYILLRTDTWKVEWLHFAGELGDKMTCLSIANAPSTFEKWISDNNGGVCCAGRYMEHVKDTAFLMYGELKPRFGTAGAMVFQLARHCTYSDSREPEEWHRRHGPAWERAVLAGLAASQVPWHLAQKAIYRRELELDDLWGQLLLARQAAAPEHAAALAALSERLERVQELNRQEVEHLEHRVFGSCDASCTTVCRQLESGGAYAHVCRVVGLLGQQLGLSPEPPAAPWRSH